MRKFVLLITVFLLATAGSGVAQDGLALMKTETGARASGMGGAFVSIGADPSSPIYNPAGATGASQFVATFGYNSYWSNINMGHGYFVSPLAGKLFIHGGIRYAGVNDLEGRTIPTINPNDVSSFDANDVSFKAGFSYRITEKVSAGVAMGWFIEKIESYRGSAFNIDLGVQAQPMEALSLGVSAVNVGSDFQIDEAEVRSRDISLPTMYRVGGSYQYRHYLGAFDIVVVDDDPHAHLGIEADLHDSFALRAGYMSGYDARNITAGASFTRRNFTFDYAFVPYSNSLGTAHLFNLTVSL